MEIDNISPYRPLNGWEGAREGAGGGAKLVQFGRKFDRFGPFLGP